MSESEEFAEDTQIEDNALRKGVVTTNPRCFLGSNDMKAKPIHRRALIVLPKRIILIRHGQSLGNQDESAYSVIPDWKIPLTELGREEAIQVGLKVKSIIGENDPLYIYVSPYMRTKQTLACMLTSLQSNPIVMVREEPRLTEQQFGNFQKTEDMEKYKQDRNKFGRFYYRFPDGESGLDVFGRVSSFIGTLFRFVILGQRDRLNESTYELSRDWAKEKSHYNQNDTTIIIITHGLTLRLFLMRWYRFTVQEFENSVNPSNGAVVVMERCHYYDTQENITERVLDDDEGVYQELFQLNDDSYDMLNLSKSVCKPRTHYDSSKDLNVILKEVEEGYIMLDKFRNSNGAL